MLKRILILLSLGPWALFDVLLNQTGHLQEALLHLGIGLSYLINYGGCLYGDVLLRRSTGLSESPETNQHTVLFRLGYTEIFSQMSEVSLSFKGQQLFYILNWNFKLLKMALPLWTWQLPNTSRAVLIGVLLTVTNADLVALYFKMCQPLEYMHN